MECAMLRSCTNSQATNDTNLPLFSIMQVDLVKMTNRDQKFHHFIKKRTMFSTKCNKNHENLKRNEEVMNF